MRPLPQHEFVAHRIESGEFRHVYEHPILVEMFGKDWPVWHVRIEPDEEGGYWAWLDAETEEYSMVYPKRGLVAMCFPYGPDVEEERGSGRIVRVRIVPIHQVRGGRCEA